MSIICVPLKVLPRYQLSHRFEYAGDQEKGKGKTPMKNESVMSSKSLTRYKIQ